MYSYALPNIRIFCSEKIALKLGLLVMAIAVFSTQGMSMKANEIGNVFEEYMQENTILKEQSDDALFLLENSVDEMKIKWHKDLKKKYGRAQIRKISDGVVYVGLIKTVKSQRVKVNVAEVNRNINPDIEIIPKMASNKMHSKSRVSNIANGALVAVNGTYFKQDTGTALGTLVINNEIYSGPIYNRVAFGISDDGFMTERVVFSGELKNKKSTIKIDNINQPRIMASNVLIYNSNWGSKCPQTKKEEKNMAVKNNIITAISTSPLNIPDGGYVISGPYDKLIDFSLGDKVEINYNLIPNWENVHNIISGGPYLMKNGQIYIDVTAEKLNSITGKNPRTAIGYTKDNVMIIVTVDGRKEGSSGMTLNELANLMKSLGCYEAINLDGGSSTSMYAGGSVYNGTSLKSSVAVSNALVVRVKKKIFNT